MFPAGRRLLTGIDARAVRPSLLTGLAREHPGLELELSFSDRIVDLIEDGYDLAIRNGPLPDSARLVARRIGDHRMTFCASPDYLARRGAPQSIGDLAGHDAVAYLRAGTLQHWQVTQPDGTLDEFVPKTRLLMDDLQAITDAAAAGFGIAWLPCWLVRERVQSGQLVQVLANYTGVFFGAYAVWPKTTHLPLKVRLAVDRLAEKLAANMGLAGGFNPDPLSATE